MKGLTSIIFILLAIGAFFFIIDPQYKEIEALQEQKEEFDKLLEKAKQLRAAREDLNRRYESFSQEELETLNKILPETVDNIRLIVDMNNIADDYGIVIRNIGVSGGPTRDSEGRNAGDSGEGDKYGTITLNFSVSTTYDIMKKYMYDLEDSLRLIDIKEFTVSAGDSNLYTFGVTLDTYWLR